MKRASKVPIFARQNVSGMGCSDKGGFLARIGYAGVITSECERDSVYMLVKNTPTQRENCGSPPRWQAGLFVAVYGAWRYWSVTHALVMVSTSIMTTKSTCLLQEIFINNSTNFQCK